MPIQDLHLIDNRTLHDYVERVTQIDATHLLKVSRIGECNHCGACCAGEFPHTLSAAQQAEYEASNYNEDEQGKPRCYHYDPDALDGHCKVYVDRPWVCGQWPPNARCLETHENCSLSFVNEVLEFGV
jgi:Fe-S-cluster containining protein